VRRTVYGFVERQNLAGDVPHVRFRRPRYAFAQAALHHGASAGVVLDEQPVRVAASDASGRTRRSEASGDGRPADGRQLFRLALGRAPEAKSWRWCAVRRICEGLGGTARRWSGDYGVRVGAPTTNRPRASSSTAAAFYGQRVAGRSPVARPGTRLGHAERLGGHPGNDAQHAAIRRWTAPRAGRLTIDGNLEHPSDQGDGVRGRVVSDRQGLVAEWTATTARRRHGSVRWMSRRAKRSIWSPIAGTTRTSTVSAGR
jgi:hypothetical protein